jgi:hypothetical protein
MNQEQIYNYQGSEGKGSVLRTTLNSDDLLAELERKLRGVTVTEDEQGNIQLKQTNKPLLNDEGVSTIIRNITLYASKDVKLSNIDKNEQQNVIRGILQDAIYSIATHSERWELEFEDFDDLASIWVNYAFLALSRGVGARELDHVYTDTSRQTVSQEQRASFSDTRKNKSMFSKDEEINN